MTDLTPIHSALAKRDAFLRGERATLPIVTHADHVVWGWLRILLARVDELEATNQRNLGPLESLEAAGVARKAAEQRCKALEGELGRVKDLAVADLRVAREALVALEGDQEQAIAFGQERGAWSHDAALAAWRERRGGGK